MKPISVPAIITSVRSRVDRSIGVSFTTPELTPQEKALFMELHGANIDLLLTPKGSLEAPVEVKSELQSKTASQRLRSVLYILWKQSNEGEFESFYKQKMEKLIDHFKEQIEE